MQKQVDTGKTIKDVKFLSDPYLSKRKNELFKRIKSSTLVKLIGENKNTESIYNLVDEPMMNNDGELSKPGQSVASFQTNRTGITTKTTVTAITYATEMLGNLVKLF